MRGLGIVLYGSEGVGKTALALRHAVLGALTCFSIDESGYEDLEIVGEVPDNCQNIKISTWENLLHQTKRFDGKVLVVDALTGLQRALFDFVCRTQYKGIWDGKDGFTSYWKGQRVDSPPVLMKWLDMLEDLRASGVHVILIGHMVTTSLPNTFGGDFMSHVIEMDDGDKGGCRSCIMKWAQAVLFMNIDIAINRVEKSTNSGVVLEGKAVDKSERLMYTAKAPGHAAKNRLHLPEVINLGDNPKEAFANYWSKMPEPYQKLVG